MPSRNRAADTRSVRKRLEDIKAEHARKQKMKAQRVLGQIEDLIYEEFNERPFFSRDEAGREDEAPTEMGEKALEIILRELEADPF